jgi:hypothetical protein
MPPLPHIGLESFGPTLLYFGGWVVFALSIFWRPQIGLYYIIPLLPLQTLRYKLHAYPMGSLWVDLHLFGVILGLWLQGNPVFTKTPASKLILGYAAFTYISLWQGAFFLDGDFPLWFDNVRLQDWKNYMVMPIIALVVYAGIKKTKQIQLLLILMSLSILLLNKYFYSTVKNRDFSHFSYSVRDAGGMGYAGVNGLAAFEAQMLMLVLCLYHGERRAHIKLGYLVLIGTCGYCLLFSLSRGGYAAFLVGVAFLGIVRIRKLLVFAVILLVSWQAFVPGAVQERIMMTQDESGEIDNSAATRLALWEDAMEMFKRNPVSGVGMNTYAYLGRVGPYRDTHNYYLKVLVETGVIGFVFFVFLLFALFWSGFRLYRLADDRFLRFLGLGFAGWMVATIASNAFGDRWTFLQISGYTWAVLGIVNRSIEIVLNEEDEPEELEEGADLERTVAVQGAA